MIQGTKTQVQVDLSGGLVTLPNLLALPANASPNCMDVKFDIGTMGKRAGSTTINSVALVSGTATGFSPDAGATLAVSLTAAWKLDEQSGTRVDSFGNNNLSDNNSILYVAGRKGNAASFVSANSQWLSVGNNTSLQAGSKPITLSTWVNLTTKTTDQGIAAKWMASNTANREYRLWYDSQRDRFAWSLRTTAGTELEVFANTLGNVSTSTWYMLTGWWDSANALSYIRVNTMVANSAGITGALQSGSGSFYLGTTQHQNGLGQNYRGFQTDTAGNLLSGLRGYWPLNEASGTRFNYVTGNVLDLTDNNSVGVAAGKIDSAASFVTANSTFFSRNDNADINVEGGNFTIAAWVYMTDTSATRAIAGHGRNVAGQENWFLVYRSDASVFRFLVWDTSGASAAANASTFGAASENTWYLVIASRDSTNGVITIQVNNGASNNATFTQNMQDTANDFTIGAIYDSTTTNVLQGRIDDVGLWARVLTAPERTDLYRTGSGNRFEHDHANAAIDETSIWRRVPTNQEILDLWNGGSGNTYSLGASAAGFGSFDFGAGQNLRWHVVAAGTGIYASSNRGVSYVIIATDRGTNYQYFERSKNLLIATSETQNKVLYWAGSVGTFMLGLPAGSAPPVKHCLDFQGYTLLMNNSAGNKRVVYYNDNNAIATGPFNTTFEVASSQDDEITGGMVYNTRAYIFTRYTVQQVSFVGGNPDFSVRQVRSWGAVPRTIKKVTFGDLGEVIICLGWDKKIRIFDGADDKIISTPVERDNTLSNVFLENLDTTNITKCHAEVDTIEQVYKLWVVMMPSTSVTHCLCLNLRTGTWYPYLNQNVNTAVMAESDNSRILTAVKQDGFVYQMDTGNTDLGTPISEYYDSSYHVGSLAGVLTKHHNMAFYFKPTSSGTLQYQDASDYARTFNASRDTIALAGASGTTLLRKVIDIPVTDLAYQFRLSSSGSTALPWTLIRAELSGDPRGQV